MQPLSLYSSMEFLGCANFSLESSLAWFSSDWKRQKFFCRLLQRTEKFEDWANMIKINSGQYYPQALFSQCSRHWCQYISVCHVAKYRVESFWHKSLDSEAELGSPFSTAKAAAFESRVSSQQKPEVEMKDDGKFDSSRAEKKTQGLCHLLAPSYYWVVVLNFFSSLDIMIAAL